jgi:hypothetical protein
VPLFYVLISQASEKFFPPKKSADQPSSPSPAADAPAASAGGH